MSNLIPANAKNVFVTRHDCRTYDTGRVEVKCGTEEKKYKRQVSYGFLGLRSRQEECTVKLDRYLTVPESINYYRPNSSCQLINFNIQYNRWSDNWTIVFYWAETK